MTDKPAEEASNAAREVPTDDITVTDSEMNKATQDAKPEASTEPETDDKPEETETQNDPGDSAEPESGDAPAQQSRKKPGVHQRIDELTKSFRDAERLAQERAREAEYWRQQAMSQQPKPQAPTAETGEPTLESCDFDQAEYQRKWYSWRRAEEKKQEAAQQRMQTFAEKEAAFRVAHPDYDTVARNPAVPITQQVAEVILETDDPPAIAYYLGQNPQEAAAIAQMTPHQIGRAIGRIEAKLSAPAAPEATRPPEPKTVTRAPPPVTTLSGAPAVRKAYEEMSQEEYEQTRREERRAKGLSP
jgi:hypothetical protein